MRVRSGRRGRVERVAVDGWLFAVGILATAACLVATRAHVGIETDSGPYLGAAHNLVKGLGVSTPFTFLSAYGPRRSVAFGNAVPLVDYPPLYPVVVSGLGALGAPLMQVTRYVGALLLGVNIVLVGLLFLTVSRGRGRPIAVALAVFMVVDPTSPNLASAGRINWLTIHGSVLSEPLFITLVLTTCLVFIRALDAGSRRMLVAAAGLAALAVLTRYVGFGLVAAGALTLLVVDRARWRRAVLFAVAGLAPAVAWSIWLRVGAHADSGRTLALHSASGTWKDLVDAVEKWLLPSPWHSTLRHSLMIGVVLVVVALAFVQRRSGNLAFVPVVLLSLLTGCFLLAVVASRALFDINAIDERMVAPIQPAAEIAAAAFVWSGIRVLWSERLATGAVATGMVVLMAVSIHPIVTVVSDGFPPLAYSASAKSVRRLPRNMPVFATSSAAVWFAAGRPAYELPARIDPFTLGRNHAYPAQVAELGALVAHRPTAVVLILSPSILLFPSVAELERSMVVRSVRAYSDGVVAVVGGPPLPRPRRVR